ncbi:MAG: hypothetical protein COA96_01460 [SAR86 cluster bacterium]|uniref:Polyketide cyclase n=1 Tax=SAR86 cluster bacterium TaxID=2030880 RepID=A0A2A5B9G7_9GAMM|nr:MAG: hypothetical protein COA96_01460 [SAR86 cluster bacterium]
MTNTFCSTYQITLPLAELQAEISMPTNLATSAEETIWREFVSFHCWQHWMPSVSQVEIDGSLDVGRGSTLLVKSRSSQTIWAISHWSPPKRIEFVVKTRNKYLAYGFSFVIDSARQEIILGIEGECEFRGPLRPLAPFLAWRQKQLFCELLNRFAKHLRNNTD